MPRFFIDPPAGTTVTLTGDSAAHISKSLRMAVGDTLVLCDGAGTDYAAEISAMDRNTVTAEITGRTASIGEPDVRIVLFQGLPKGDKMDWIVQKAVELGAAEIVPFAAARSVSRLDDDGARKKTARWQKIADEAAGQCQRGRLPQVAVRVSYTEALRRAAARRSSDLWLRAAACDRIFFCYEGGGAGLRTLLAERPGSVAVFVGPEGGFAPEEVAQAEAAGAVRVTLGTRILRTETAPLAALSAILFATGNL